MKIIDAHSHIDYITHKYQSDVVGTVCCSTGEPQWQILIDMMNSDKKIYGAFGIHPWYICDIKNGFEKRLYNLLNENPKYMIGEIGLDKYKPDMEKQIDVFIKHFDVAIQLNRIVFLHCVGAWDKIFYILKQYKQSQLPIIVVHDFNGNENITSTLLKYKNIYFSFGKNVLNGRNSCIEHIPSCRILVESDGNNSVLLKDVVMQIMNIKKDTNISNVIYNNTIRVLRNEKIAQD